MSEQLPLVLPPAARSTDPSTSILAADEVTRSGARRRQCDQVLAALRQTPGLSTRELAERHGLDRYVVARRMADLDAAGLAYRQDRSATGERCWPTGGPWAPACQCGNADVGTITESTQQRGSDVRVYFKCFGCGREWT